MSASSCRSTAPARKAPRSRCASALFEEFADRYFPEPASAAAKPDPTNAKADAEKLAGLYSTTRGSRSNFLAVVDLIGQTKVTVGEDGNPVVAAADGLNGQPRKWVHVGPMLWRDANGHEMLGANVADGKATRFSFGELAPIIDFDRTPWIPLFGLAAAVALLLARRSSLLTILLWPTRAIVRRRFKSALPLEGRQLWAYRSSRIAAIAILAVLIGWVVADVGAVRRSRQRRHPGFAAVACFSCSASSPSSAASRSWRGTPGPCGGRGGGGRPRRGASCCVIAAGTVLYVALVFKLIGLATNY